MRLSARANLTVAILTLPLLLPGCGGDDSVQPDAVASVSVTASPNQIEVGESVQLTVVVRNSAGGTLTGRTVTYESNAPEVASVDPEGLVTGVSAGNALITATSEGVEGTVNIAVSDVQVALVTVTPDDPDLEVGETVQLTATVEDFRGNELTGRTITWISSETDVATVSTSGLVEAVGEGSSVVSAESGGVSGRVTVTVATAGSTP